MFAVRSILRLATLGAAALLPLAASSGCATGASGDTGEGGSGSGADGNPPPPTDSGNDMAPLPDSYPSGDTGSKDGGADHSTMKDSGGSDSPVDTGPVDTGPPDTGACTVVAVSDSGAAPVACPATGSTCGSMSSLSGFTPSAVPPAPASKSCTTTQINSIYKDCLGPTATSAKCTAIATTAKACYGCILTTEGASAYGPLIETTNGGLVFLNQAGCIDLAEPCNTACGTAFLDAFQCESAACEPTCPSSSTITSAQVTNFQACITTATGCDPGGCDGYATEATNCAALLTGPSHPASVCIPTALPDGGAPTFQDLYNAIVPVFCGP